MGCLDGVAVAADGAHTSERPCVLFGDPNFAVSTERQIVAEGVGCGQLHRAYNSRGGDAADAVGIELRKPQCAVRSHFDVEKCRKVGWVLGQQCSGGRKLGDRAVVYGTSVLGAHSTGRLHNPQVVVRSSDNSRWPYEVIAGV